MRKRKGWPIAIGLVVLAVVAVFVAAAVVPGGASQARAVDPVVLTVNHNGTFVKSYTQSDLAALGAYSGYAGIINSGGVVTGPDPVQGVALKVVLADALGATAFTAQQSLDIYSPSPAPYIQTLTYAQVEEASPSTFVMTDATTKQPVTTLADTLSSVLVWASGNPLTTLPADQGPLRFYVADAQNDNVVMVGSMSVFDVTQLNVRDQVLPPWNVKLVGLKINGTRPTDTIDQNTYQSCSAEGCHGAVWKSAAGQRFTGVPLYLLMGEVDGGKDMTYNAALARAGYRIRLYNAAGKYVTLSSKVTVRRSSVLVANGVSGAALGAATYPLRLVGPTKYVPSSQRLGSITKIVMLPRLK